MLKQSNPNIFQTYTFLLVILFFFFKSERAPNYFEISSGIKVRVTFKRFLGKCHINLPLVHRHQVNPLLYSFGAPLGFSCGILGVYWLVQSFSCCQSDLVFMPGTNYARSPVKVLQGEREALGVDISNVHDKPQTQNRLWKSQVRENGLSCPLPTAKSSAPRGAQSEDSQLQPS